MRPSHRSITEQNQHDAAELLCFYHPCIADGFHFPISKKASIRRCYWSFERHTQCVAQYLGLAIHHYA